MDVTAILGKNTARYRASAPSNIAFIKYWGKRDEQKQWPANDSLSMTLSAAHTVTLASISAGIDHRLVIDGKEYHRSSSTGAKAFDHLDRLKKILDANTTLNVVSHNHFPMGAGVASSASGLAALTLAASAAWTGGTSFDELAEFGLGRERLANLARLGSGSAARSLFGGFVHWQAGASPEAQNVVPIHSAKTWALCDIIVLFSEREKAVSSTTAHRAAWSSPLYPSRLEALPERLSAISDAIGQANLRILGPILEQEALEMHAVIMSAAPAVVYLTPEVSQFLAWVRRMRRECGLEAYFTVDAGAAVHLICEESTKSRLVEMVRQIAPDARMICDAVGPGPTVSRLHVDCEDE